MQKIIHTPGPWSVWNFNDDPRHVAVGPEAGGLAVADIVACNAHGCYTAQTEAQGAANARLIAAAPDLLAALERLHDDWTTISGIDHGAGDEYADIRNIHLQVMAAIAKAKGE